MSLQNPILNTDSYKLGHFLQYPEETRAISGYVTTRGASTRPEIVFFGLQAFLKSHLSRQITEDHVDEAEEIAGLQGQPFNRAGWERVVDSHDGYLPLRIEALPEGMLLRRDLPMVQVISTDPELPWLTGFVETALLRAIWYPSTVATRARRLKDTLRPLYEQSCDDAEAILEIALADYGARAASSEEQAGLGGLAHLLSFGRSDTLAAIEYGRRFYAAALKGTTLPASEHTTMIVWGQDREEEAFANMLERFQAFPSVSVVSDSYDIANAVSDVWGKALKSKVIAEQPRLIVRPDSGDPIDTPVQVVSQLAYAFGTRQNAKGYKVIEHGVRVLQADAVSIQDITMVLGRLEGMGFSAENITFGMGSSLLQRVSRDTFSFTMKSTAWQDGNGRWHDMARRQPPMRAGNPKSGRRAVINDAGDVYDIPLSELGSRENLLRPVWEEGRLLRDWTFDEVRQRARREV
ncbi:nicotinate phosphoribosyltransferase [Rhizobium halophytocola]|uniref:Nicotinamide phosphoribosyltransferase n=1 Tax=Rhizobium halophytocola TaxID=735519 RepID=A0ABS4E141_9HYPH|nr:nicotinate phosphoribosyltransferase [Rhizobium halophytocola]MBP1851651.1 nicotinamide phosphoribosyltransferase [Rhizobium halophytocola]